MPGDMVRLPFEFGQIVYHRVASQREPGMVTGFEVRESGTAALVTWPNRQETFHFAYELTTEYIPDFSTNAD